MNLPQALFAGARFSRAGSSFQREALEEARQRGEIEGDVHIETLAWQIHLQFVGSLLAWACATINDSQFQRASELAALAPLAACATPQVRTRLDLRLQELLRQSPAALTS